MIRKTAFTSRDDTHRDGAAAVVAQRPMPANSKTGFVEFHPSMSLENPTTVVDFLPPAAPALGGSGVEIQSAESDAELKLGDVLAQRAHVWTKVSEITDKLKPVAAYRGDVLALQKLQQLRLLCKQRETHLRTLQLTLLQEGRALPDKDDTSNSNSNATLDPSEASSEEEAEADQSASNPEVWKQDGHGHVEIVDSDTVDLIELSEQPI